MNLFRTKSIEQSMADADEPGRKLKRSLSTWDLMIMGVAVAVGAGIFSVGAKAAANFAGPAVTISFAIAAVTCALAIMCYAEFATAIPVAGSAYVFTYATMGEILAWIIGWNLILELFTAGAVIAKYWGIYLSKVFALMGVDIPPSISPGRRRPLLGRLPDRRHLHRAAGPRDQALRPRRQHLHADQDRASSSS